MHIYFHCNPESNDDVTEMKKRKNSWNFHPRAAFDGQTIKVTHDCDHDDNHNHSGDDLDAVDNHNGESEEDDSVDNDDEEENNCELFIRHVGGIWVRHVFWALLIMFDGDGDDDESDGGDAWELLITSMVMVTMMTMMMVQTESYW